MTVAHDAHLMTYCRVMQVGPACPHPCGGCRAANMTWDHDHWGNVERDGYCRFCLGETADVQPVNGGGS